jgi:hypothetical protein
MRRRIRVYRVKPGAWRAERPRVGFAPTGADVEVVEAPTRPEVCALLAARGGTPWKPVAVPRPKRS